LAEAAPVLLMDWDLHQPELSKKLDRRTGQPKAGVTTAPLSDRIVRDSFGFDFLPAPTKRSAAHPSQVLTSASFRDLMTTAQSRYRYCVVDLPSLGHVDARAAASMFDVFLLVVEFGAVTTVDIDRALLLSRSVADRLLGALINKAPVRK
jgi:polysaccharide biosynthesis transport protein